MSKPLVQHAALAIKHPAYRRGRYLIACALAYAGENAQAESLAQELARDFPQDTVVQFAILPTLRAKLVLNRGKIDESVENRIRGFPDPLERRRPRHPHPERSQSRVREAAVAAWPSSNHA
jgi:hypothetical protein